MGDLIRVGAATEETKKKTVLLKTSVLEASPRSDLPNEVTLAPKPTDTSIGGTDGDKLINALQWTYEQWETARRPHKAVWERAWALFNNEWDFTDKADWQSQRSLPKVTMAVKRLSATITRILSMSNDWFGTETSAPSQQKYMNLVKDLMKWFLDEDNADFESIFSNAIEVGMLSQIMPVLVTWDVDGWHHPTLTDDNEMIVSLTEGEPRAGSSVITSDLLPTTPFDSMPGRARTRPRMKRMDGKLRYELLNPNNVLLDPTGRFRGVIIERHYSRGEFAAEAEVRNFIHVEDVLSYTYSVMDKEAEESRQRGQVSSVDKDGVYLQEYWGSLFDEHGNRLLDNEYFIVANKRFVVLPPTPNPFWHGEIPVVVCGMVSVPFGVYHQGFIGMNADSFELWVEFINLTIDYFQKIMIGMNEIDMDMLYDADETDINTAFPGKMWKKRNAQGKPMVTTVPMGDLPQGTFPFLSLISQELTDGTALSDATEGTPRTRGKQSAQEFTRRMAEAGVLLDYIYRNIEKNLLKKAISLGFKTVLQFMSQKDWAEWITRRQDKYPELAEEFEVLKAMPAAERYELFGQDISFQTKVFSAVFDRQAVIEKLTFFIATTGRLPFVAQYVKWGGILKKFVEALQYDVEDIVSDTPIKPMSDIMTPGNNASSTFGGSDGGESIPMQPPEEGQMEDQSTGILGGSGAVPPGLDSMMPGIRRSGNPKNR